MRSCSAPGRVNLLGEHVDRHGGTVLPVAIALRVRVRFEEGGAWSFRSAGHADARWTRFARAVIDQLAEEGAAPRPGTILVESALPEGRGLGSSAALEVAVAGALSDLEPFPLARLCRRAENSKAHVPCGLMDQAASACARAGHILALDCARERFRHVPLPGVSIHLFDSGVGRTLASTPYAARLEEARIAGSAAARHVEAEKARVLEGLDLLARGDVARFGALLYESHRSLRDLYRCSHPALDRWVEACRATQGVLGARLTGAGWGGSGVALARPGTEVPGARPVASDDGLCRHDPGPQGASGRC